MFKQKIIKGQRYKIYCSITISFNFYIGSVIKIIKFANSKHTKTLEVVKTLNSLNDALKAYRSSKQIIALVPTMGALHDGHLSLIREAFNKADIVVCSIFVNPTQFTDPKDLEKYPRPLEHDLKMLTSVGCNLVFMPTVTEMYPNYPEPEPWHIDLGPAEFLLEGKFRKGHYQGVTQIVYKLFEAVKPNIAMFGQKDFQQVLMIKNMVNYFNLPIEIITCPIIREDDGLAMSSRNIHLSLQDRVNSLTLSKVLFFIQSNYNHLSVEVLLEKASHIIEISEGIKLDYLSLANTETLLPIEQKTNSNTIALIAAKVGDTRLIDNIIIN